MKYLTLLRGINVGGNNIIKKDKLKMLFESIGCTSVLTYIQSGNILFSFSSKNKKQLTEKIAQALNEYFKKDIPFVVYSEDEYKNMLAAAPKFWNKDVSKKYNALFLLKDMSVQEALDLFPDIEPKYEEITCTPGVIFWSGTKKEYAKTSYTKNLVKSKLYKIVTIRNGNTTIKLERLFDDV